MAELLAAVSLEALRLAGGAASLLDPLAVGAVRIRPPEPSADPEINRPFSPGQPAPLDGLVASPEDCPLELEVIPDVEPEAAAVLEDARPSIVDKAPAPRARVRSAAAVARA